MSNQKSYFTFVHVLLFVSTLAFKENVVERCYKDIGCLSITPDFFDPIHRPLNKLPTSREDVNTRFSLFDPFNEKIRYHLSADPTTIITSSYNGILPTKMIVPGFLDQLEIAPWMTELARALLSHTPCNVILVEWNNIAAYSIACANARLVGLEIANLILHLERYANTTREKFHIIGHSLGAHIAGYTGERLPGLGRISALDPARPYFEHMPVTVRLDPKDANFVDVIHSDITPPFPLGCSEPLGHVDFYPNGPHWQPGCHQEKFQRGLKGLERGVLHGLVQSVRFKVSCPHQRAYLYYIESIKNKKCKFVAQKCSNYQHFLNGHCRCRDSPIACIPMGIESDYLARAGVFPDATETYRWFVRTGFEEPFCQFQYHVRIKLSVYMPKNVFGKFIIDFIAFDGQRSASFLVPFENRQFTPVYSRIVTNDRRINLDAVSLIVTTKYNDKLDEALSPLVSLRSVTITPTEIRELESRKTYRCRPAQSSNHIYHRQNICN